jgi:hypothetical protein
VNLAIGCNKTGQILLDRNAKSAIRVQQDFCFSQALLLSSYLLFYKKE